MEKDYKERENESFSLSLPRYSKTFINAKPKTSNYDLKVGGGQLRKSMRNFVKCNVLEEPFSFVIRFSNKNCTVNSIKIKDWFLFSSKFAYLLAHKTFPFYNSYPTLLIKLRKDFKVH